MPKTYETMTRPELEAKAAEYHIDVTGCRTKEDVYQAIVRGFSEQLMADPGTFAEKFAPVVVDPQEPDDGIFYGVTEEKLPSVAQAIGQVKRSVRSVSKDRVASKDQGGYKFRGIEGVLDAVHGPMAEAGVFMVPRDLQVLVEPWPFYKSEAWHMTKVEVEWTIYGPAGDSIMTSNWGEALDNADKALGKARSYAQKDLLIRLLELPTGDEDVSDTESTPLEQPSEGRRLTPRPRPPGAAEPERIREIRDLAQDIGLEQWVKDQGFPWPWPDAACDAIEAKAQSVSSARAAETAPDCEADADDAPATPERPTAGLEGLVPDVCEECGHEGGEHAEGCSSIPF